MPVMTAPVSHVSQQQAARMLRVSLRQLLAWQRAGLLQQGHSFSLRDLARLRSLRSLRQQRLSTRAIRNSLDAMQRILGECDPLDEAGTVSTGSRLLFRHGGALLDPITQQLAFDFEADVCRGCELQTWEPVRRQQGEDHAKAQQLFQQAVRVEEEPGQAEAAAALYRQALQAWPRHAPACINLGTILYNSGQFQSAEEQYRAAVEIDPDYALAFFDLGNVLDELRKLPEAIAAYQRAVHLCPRYADAHYNLALAYERMNERRRALRHWMHYVRLDPISPWATHARLQARRTLASERLSIVTRGGKLA